MRRRGSSKRRWLRGLLAGFLAFLALWSGGFVQFSATVAGHRQNAGQAADGIVVLTGSSVRLFEGRKLLRDGRAGRLLLSGVNPSVTRSELQQAIGLTAAEFDCCVDIGWKARDTVGNAEEIGAWAQSLGLTSLLVVTDDYHMPRSLIELNRASPDVRYVAHPVTSIGGADTDSWRRLNTWRRWAGEFNKYAVSLIRMRLLSMASTGSTI